MKIKFRGKEYDSDDYPEIDTVISLVMEEDLLKIETKKEVYYWDGHGEELLPFKQKE